MKKTAIRKLTAAGLVFTLTAGQLALASEALGHDLHSGTTALSTGTSVVQGYFWSDTYNDLRTERYVSYEPNSLVTPTVAYGDYILQKATLSKLAASLEKAGKRVVGGTNGDFYVLATGQPLGMVVTDGVLRSSSSYHPAIGFRSDGTAFIGTPSLQITASMLGERMTVFGGLNKIRQIRTTDSGGLTLLTRDFAVNTQNTSAGVDVILEPVREELGEVVPAEENTSDQDLVLTDVPTIGGRIRCSVVKVEEGSTAISIPEGCLVLTMNAQDDPGTLNMLRALKEGDEVTLDITSKDTRWNEAVEAVGGMYRLLENGQVGSNLSTERTARTAVGIKEDGSVLFYTIDGKQSGLSVGATCKQVAMRLQELGCVEAIGLDGGGSTTLGVTYPDATAMEVINSPSDGAQRAVSNAIFLTTTQTATGEAGSIRVQPGDAMLLAGAQLELTARYLDTAWYDMGPAEKVRWSVKGGGSVSGEGLFTAPAVAGSTTVTASEKGLSGTASLTTIATPSIITVKNENSGGTVSALALSPGEVVELTASSIWRNLSLLSQDTCYTWSCDPAVGSITEEGTFTASAVTATGNVRVTAGSKTVTIPVNVAGHLNVLDDMEGTATGLTDTTTLTAVRESSLNYVHNGLGSLKLSYDTTATGMAEITLPWTIEEGDDYLGLWLYGDGSGNSVTLQAKNAKGEETPLAVTGLNFTGWKHFLLKLPAGTTRLSRLQVIYGGGKNRTGSIWLDHLTSANEPIEDLTAPVIDLEVEGQKLTAVVSDNFDQELSKAGITLTFDGRAQSFQFDAATGKLTATLPELGELLHRVTVTAADTSGNLRRRSADVGQVNTMIFADMEEHWAASYANYLYGQGITKGVSLEGEQNYQPDSNITRAEFFTMVARWMGLDLDSYSEVELPLADVEEIPAWALPAVRAMYAKGFIQGSLEGGKLYAHPNAGITRVEAVTVLGRTQSCGYPAADLSKFTDRGDIPAWAEAFVSSLVGQEVLNGYSDGTIRPSAPMTRGEVAKVLYTLR